ncbi:MAG: recombination protein O N-terminal domain-containing protein, partial [Alphaproteobacteria bacterium]
MEWSDDGVVLGARKHGEHALVVSLFTRAHGRHAGLVRGGAGRRARGIYQPGNLVRAT